MGQGPIVPLPEEIKELISEIIKTLNDKFGTNFTEDDKPRIERFYRRIQADEKYRATYMGDNTETNNWHAFGQL